LRREKAAQKSVVTQVAQSETNSPPNSPVPQILIATKFVAVPDKSLKDISTAWAPLSGGGAMCLLSEQQFNTINEAMNGAGDVTVLCSPRVQTYNGGGSHVSITRSVPLGGTDTNIGARLELTPYFSTNSFTVDLNLAAEFSQLIDTSLQQDGSQSEVQATTITNSVSFSEFQTLVLQRELPAGKWLKTDFTNVVAGPKSLLVFVTPTIGYFTNRLQNVIRRADTNR
jgi:type II secretory pathway component GspD/PulD (secretin)